MCKGQSTFATHIMSTVQVALTKRTWCNTRHLDARTCANILCCYPCALGVQWETVFAPNKTTVDALVPRTCMGFGVCVCSPHLFPCCQAYIADNLARKVLYNRERPSAYMSYFIWSLFPCFSCAPCIATKAAKSDRTTLMT